MLAADCWAVLPPTDVLRPADWVVELNPKMLFPELENVKGVVEAVRAFEDATAEDENVAVLEKEEDVTGEIEIFEGIDVVLRFGDALLAISCAVDLASSVEDALLEPKLNVPIAGIGDDICGLLLD
ncbi:hypothetical protein GUJ93_ZPchr0013g34631 [Zizania palustris]|uniref:Uncharacterized protein n=1 Tax=Zizania palustris TaxID=103762 RepID=A0A8J5X6G4_ZIZPA|nr:hypothetical protein GUJ93_ZPchr0013g34631 [Zizania palustris]